jgi:hypothetical protein
MVLIDLILFYLKHSFLVSVFPISFVQNSARNLEELFKLQILVVEITQSRCIAIEVFQGAESIYGLKNTI